MSSIRSDLSPILSPASAEASRRTSAPAKERDWSQPSTESSEQSFSFRDFLSVINPLQHIPIVGSIYRAITGDTVSPASRVIGGFIFGGPLGLVASALNAAVEQTKGKDLGDQALAMLVPDKAAPGPAEPSQFAQAASLPAARSGDDAPIDTAAPEAQAPTPPISTVPLGADRTLGASLLRQPPGADRTLPSQGRTLVDYRNFTGRPLPVIDTNRSAGSHSTPVRLQPSAPLPERMRTIAPSPAKEARDSEPAPASSASSNNAETSNPPAANDEFVAAMSRGLDRYRAQRRPGAPLQIDATL